MTGVYSDLALRKSSKPKLGKNVYTMLFADYRESTKQVYELAPEDALEFLELKLKLMISPIERAGGMILRIKGDGVVALFDDNELLNQSDCAVTAAINILSNFGRSDLDTIFKVRIGVCTGEVLVNEVKTTSSKFLQATGIITHIAARLEEMANPGDLLISKTAYELLTNQGLFYSLGSLKLKGIAENVDVYALKDSDPACVLYSDNIDETDLNIHASVTCKIKGILENDRALLIGPPGIGKSTILRNVHNASLGYYHKVFVSIRPENRFEPLSCVKQVLFSYLGLADKRPKIDLLVESISSRLNLKRKRTKEIAEFLLRDTMKATENFDFGRTLALLSPFYSEDTGVDLCLVCLDDLQFIDKESLQILRACFEQKTCIWRLVGTTTSLTQIEFECKSIYIQHINAREKKALCRRWIRNAPAIAPFLESAIKLAGDNLSSLKTLCRALSNSDTLKAFLEQGEGLNNKLFAEHYTKYYIKLLLGKLEEPAINVLQIISTLDQGVNKSLLIELGKRYGLSIGEILKELSADGHTLVSGTRVWIRDGRLRDLIYDGMEKNRKQKLHSEMIDFIRKDRLLSRSEQVGLLNLHAARCGDDRLALRYTICGGRRAMRNNHLGTAMQFYEQSIKILNRSNSSISKRLQLKLMMEILEIVGVSDKANDQPRLLDQIQVFVDENDILDSELVAKFHCQNAVYLSHSGGLLKAVTEGNTALKLLKNLRSSVTYNRAALITGHALYHRGEYHAALELLNRKSSGTSNSRITNSIENSQYVSKNSVAAGCQIYTGDFTAARSSAKEALQFSETSENVLDVGVSCYFYGLLCRWTRELEEGKEILKKGYSWSTANGFDYLNPWLMAELIYIKFLSGEKDHAIRDMDECLYKANSIDLKYASTLINLYKGQISLQIDNFSDAISCFYSVISKSRSYGYDGLFAIALIDLAVAIFKEDSLSINLSRKYLAEAEQVSNRLGMKLNFPRQDFINGELIKESNPKLARSFFYAASEKYSDMGLIAQSIECIQSSP